MPYVNVKITREGVTAAQKAAVIAGITQLLKDELGKNPETTFVIIDEVDTDNWGIGGESVTTCRKDGRYKHVDYSSSLVRSKVRAKH